MKEYEYIDIIKSVIDKDSQYIGNDTAVIKETGLVMTVDTMVEDTHFIRNVITPFDLGYKALAVNLSDIATSGGVCHYILVSLALPKNLEEGFIEDFYKGLQSLAQAHHCAVVGGDLTQSEKIVITLTAIGYTKVTSNRSNLREGQKILVTGDFGASYAGLTILNQLNHPVSKESMALVERHFKPTPRIKEAQYFVTTCPYPTYCMMDTSDGLADALYQISQKSQKGVIIDTDKIPVTPFIQKLTLFKDADPIEMALFGGEDFELVIACNPEDAAILTTNPPYSFTEIGEVTNTCQEVRLIYNDKKIILLDRDLLEKKISFKHF